MTSRLNDDGSAPRVVVTLAVAARQSRPDLAARRNELYVAAVERHGAIAIPLDAAADDATRGAALGAMDGLLFSGGADLDPARFGQPIDGAVDIEPDRDELEAMAWAAAAASGTPVLGICRGIQAINVFSGGSLLQHVDGHVGAGWGVGEPATHPLRLVPGTRLSAALGDPDTLEVNAYHHQGIRADDLAPGLRAAAWADSAAGPLVEGVEATDDRFVVGVQCHPERTESTPAAFEQLFATFVAAARRHARERRSAEKPGEPAAR